MSGALVPDTSITGTVVQPALTDWDTLYSEPGKLGLEIVGEADDELADYSFDKFVVWRDQQGRLYYASDSGCSCPSPFEDYKKVSDLTKATVAEIHAALDEWAQSGQRLPSRRTIGSRPARQARGDLRWDCSGGPPGALRGMPAGTCGGRHAGAAGGGAGGRSAARGKRSREQGAWPLSCAYRRYNRVPVWHFHARKA
jgi:hypothetical protein